MKFIQLSKRLQAVASFVEKDAIIADIGSDHAWLPIYLVKKGISQQAVAGEVAQGPYDSALRNIARESVGNRVYVRLANGLHAIEAEDRVDTITIAGMGGSLIATILEEGKHKLDSIHRIIAQPNLYAIALREWAVRNKWKIVNEIILKEEGKIYEVIVLEKGEADYNDLELLMGPILLKEKSTVFREKWLLELNQWKHIIEALEKAEETELTIKKKNQLERQIHDVEEVLEA